MSMLMDIFLWMHIVYCSWEYRIELHEYIGQSGQMNVVQLLYLLQIRELEVKKLRNSCVSLLFCMGLCLRLARTTVQVLIQVLWFWKHGHKMKKLMAHSKSPAWNPWAQFCREGAEEWISSSLAPWRQLFTQPSRFRVVFVTGFKPRAYLHQLLQIRALGQSQNLFIGHLSVRHVFSSSLDGGVSPPPSEIKKCFSSWACEQRQQKHKASCAASSSSLSCQWMIAVWGGGLILFGFWEVEGLEIVSRKWKGNQQANHQRKGKKKKAKKSCISVIYSWDVQQGSLKFPSPRGSWLASF